MGGYGSGQWRSARHMTVEQCCVFECAWLRRRGALESGGCAWGQSFWTLRPSGEAAGSIDWQADLRDLSAPLVWLRYHAASERVDERVPLVPTEPPYGGTRWWFSCPRCGRRCAKLYLPSGATRFRCRRCHRLVYQCQRETRSDRMLRRAEKLRRHIGCAPGESPRMAQKPKYMRNRTYWRLREQANALDAVSFCLAVGRLLPHIVPPDFDPLRAAGLTPQRTRRRRKRVRGT
jgi:hypothetical protein